MIDRYKDDNMDVVFSPQQTIHRWRDAAVDAMQGRVDAGVAPSDAATVARVVPPPDYASLRTREAVTGHDVVAFLQLWSEAAKDHASEEKVRIFRQHLHYGLTSSDLVDTAHHEALLQATQVILRRTSSLCVRLSELENEHQRTYMLGRTHGQPAEPTTFGHRMRVFRSMAARAVTDLERTRKDLMVRKVPGAVGTSSIYDGTISNWQVPSTQVIPRDIQAGWAMSCIRAVAVCEAIATEVRLLAQDSIGEVREGLAYSRIGSSAMPHKKNPILAERICGLARVARGCLPPILESISLWNDRDISNSSVDRTSVVDLAHLTATILNGTTNLIASLQVDTEQMRRNLDEAGYQPYASVWVAVLQEFGLGYVEASALVREAFLQEDAYQWMLEHVPDADLFDRVVYSKMDWEWMVRNVTV